MSFTAFQQPPRLHLPSVQRGCWAMKQTETTRWIEAAKILGRDPRAEVRCPRNEDAILVVEDQAHEGQRTFERHMRCPKCGAYNAMRMTKE
jgi:hypothetical protein